MSAPSMRSAHCLPASRRRRSASTAPEPSASTPATAAARPSRTTHRGKLFLFDEPTTGLHFEDVAKLLKAFRKLLIAGHSLLVIEHNLDVIRAADWIIDLGPEGGERGGEIVCAGTAAQLRPPPRSFTGEALRAYGEALRVAG